MKFMKLTKKTIYVGLFAILYLIVAFSSFFHACAFFGLANNSWMSIILAFAFEVGQAAVLFSLLTSPKDRGRIMPWVLMGMFTLVQVIGNVYSSYKYIITNSVENLRYFKEPIFIWTDLPDAQANVIIVYLVGALLPIAALLLTSMITNYLTDQSEENNEPILISEIHSDKGPENPPIEIKNEEEFLKVYGDKNKNDQEIDNLNVALDKKDEEIDNLKKELEKLKNEKENTQQGLSESNVGLTGTTEIQGMDGTGGEPTITEDKSDSDNGKWDVETTENKSTTESETPEDIAPKNDEKNDESNSGNDQQETEQAGLEGDKSGNGESDIKNELVENLIKDDKGFSELEEMNNLSETKIPNKSSHFINLN